MTTNIQTPTTDLPTRTERLFSGLSTPARQDPLRECGIGWAEQYMKHTWKDNYDDGYGATGYTFDDIDKILLHHEHDPSLYDTNEL
ncbi:hypothetical protein CLAFUW4_10496 [Fulvia fulva]|uniref:Uncharacterized protein n=1 Tax=Passalora fulva TaxID=5499 RepID=A0A9Q8LGJ8_PASFU|nr:uncharacterized protein CLAFUR5_05111 [Fulvia fulva]KAK4615890.1 hypothetical protein CLAFUR4_10499 [Fulvia fulva]KAK4616528.1 hypothetical protein CLAFUR0_10501 [Fulvia fulva]UJO16764.1 hypothetical protein CLAFUR5_05111 [Fulvia fulva]WPV19661.1 hypothetical protein CLAFUW4_10496 [Fulvia fulva]WPV33791.1 hypothetical protein CLAFUW7_10496 [Fulvia fulva]